LTLSGDLYESISLENEISDSEPFNSAPQ